MAHVPFSYIPQLVVRFFCLIILVIFPIRGIISFTKKKSTPVENNKIFIGLLLLFIIIETTAHIRAAYSNIVSPEIAFWNWISWICLAFFAFILFLKKRNTIVSFEYRKAVCYALIAYITTNCLLQIIGFNPPYSFSKTFPAVLLAKFGINISRTLFPTSVGFNSIGIMGGAASIAGLLFLLQGKKKFDRIFGLVGFLAGLYVILLTDCRGALIFTVAACLIMVLPFKRTLPVLRWFAPISLTFPFALIQTMQLFQGVSWLSLSRSTSGEGANSLLSGRLVIWTAFSDFLKNFQPMHLIGYGFEGQLITRISKLYSHLFIPWALPETTTAHNFPLQLTIEIGYLGLFLTLVLITIVLFKLGKNALENNDLPSKTLFFVMIYMLFTGSTESVFTLGHPETQYVLMLIFTGSLTLTTSPKIQLDDIQKSSAIAEGEY